MKKDQKPSATPADAGTEGKGASLKSRTAKGLMWGLLNNGTMQVLGALFGIILLRLLRPEDYGKIAMLMVFANIASTLQESGFTAALCNLKTPSHRDYNAVFWFNISVSFLLYLILFFSAPLIAWFYNDPDLLWLSRYLFLGFFISSWGTVQRAYLFIHLMNRQSCIIVVVAMLVSNTVGVTMAWLGMAYWGLATQSILFILVVAVMNWYFSPWRPTLEFDLRPAWKMFGFSSKLLLTNIVNNLSSNAFGFLLGHFSGDYTAGIYSNARKWNDMCSTTINGMLVGVAQPVLSRVRDDQAQHRQVFRKMLRFISLVSFPAMLGVGLISHEFLVIVGGEKWQDSADILRLLCLYGAIFPILSLYSNMTISQGKSNINMWCTIILSALILTGLVALHSFGLRIMVCYFIAINALWLFVWQYFAWRLIHLTLWQVARDILPFFLLSLAVMAATYWATLPITNLWLLMLSRIAMAAGLYLGLTYLSGARILRECIQFLLHKGKVN